MLTTTATLLLAPLLPLALAQSQSVPQPGTTIPLLFINTTSTDVTATVQHTTIGGATTYLVNCAANAPSTCTIHDSTITILSGQTYDFSTGTNSGGSLTIHCALNGRTPTSCTRTVAGGPEGYQISTSKPAPGQWKYLPVKITKVPVLGGGGGAMDVYGYGDGSSVSGGDGQAQAGASPLSGDGSSQEGVGSIMGWSRLLGATGICLAVAGALL